MLPSLSLMVFILISVQGCGLPLPETPVTASGQEVKSLVGDAKSKRMLRLGVTTRLQVIKSLGEPNYETVGLRALGYVYVVKATWWFDLFVVSHGFYIFPWHRPYTPAYYYLFFEFEGSTKLCRSALQRRYGYDLNDNGCIFWREFLKSVPDNDAATTRPAPYFSGT
jgi:hypothetical protein